MPHRERKSLRLKNWDYRRDGMYFITICTRDRVRYFGEIRNGKMIHSPAGAIANVLWYDISRNSDTIDLGEFAIMPDHMHGIIILSGNQAGDPSGDSDPSGVVACNDPTVSTVPPAHQKYSAISPKPNSISTIIRSYKSAVTKHCNRLEIDFGWQSLFHDRVIRNKSEFQRISKYIADNPLRWKG